jgi:hypothetical protein
MPAGRTITSSCHSVVSCIWCRVQRLAPFNGNGQ